MSYTITSPNTCALLECVFPDFNSLTYVEGEGANVYPSSASTADTFTEYLTPEDAAAAAILINPDYNVNQILGSLTLDPVNVSNPEQSAYIGTDLTLNCEYSCGDCTVVYEWLNPGGLPIPGATTSSLTLSNLTEKLDGVYTCNASARNAKGQTGFASGSFKVTVYPAIVPGASELA